MGFFWIRGCNVCVDNNRYLFLRVQQPTNRLRRHQCYECFTMQMNDYRSGSALSYSSLSIVVAATTEVGIYAFANTVEIFNSAPLTGKPVSINISAFVVYGWSGQAGAHK